MDFDPPGLFILKPFSMSIVAFEDQCPACDVGKLIFSSNTNCECDNCGKTFTVIKEKIVPLPLSQAEIDADIDRCP